MFKLTAALIVCILYISCAQANSEVHKDATGNLVGGSNRRSLSQSYGIARNTNISTSSSGTSSASAYAPRGNECYISSSRSASIDCSKEGTGTILQQVPACCTSTSTSSSTTCNTFDNAGAIQCSNSARPYPACCTLRDQPASTCLLASSTLTTISCTDSDPFPACCNSRSSICSVNPANIRGGGSFTCSTSQYDACCPA